MSKEIKAFIHGAAVGLCAGLAISALTIALLIYENKIIIRL
jgi:hypothetical protein